MCGIICSFRSHHPINTARYPPHMPAYLCGDNSAGMTYFGAKMRTRAKFIRYVAFTLLWAFDGLAAGSGPKAQPDRVVYMSFHPSNST